MYWEFPSGRQASAESRLAKRLQRRARFYVFLWEVRSELFDSEFQSELMEAYAPRGQAPCPPAQLAMAMLLQRYAGVSDAEAVVESSTDRKWQLVLGNLDEEDAPFGQGTLVRFRERMIEHDLDRKLVDRTIELAKRTKKFGWKNLKVALDASPFEGAGRVEDTWNLIGRAMGRLVGAVAEALGVEKQHVIDAAGLTVLDGPSVKAALDIDWSDVDERSAALQRLVDEAEQLASWIEMQTGVATHVPVVDALALLRRVIVQDLEPDPDGGGRRIRHGVAQERIVSIGDPEMRHGRKSKTKTINGFKRHIVAANRFILGTAVEPANRREHVPTQRLLNAARRHGRIRSIHFDRGYLASPALSQLRARGVELHSRPWRAGNRHGDFFEKEKDFHIDLDANGVVCPAGATARIYAGGQAHFNEADCQSCRLKAACTPGRYRTVKIHDDEDLLIELREAQASSAGRRAYRERTVIEHRLARIDAIQGKRARYVGVRKNELVLNRSAAVANLQEIDRLRRAA